MLTSFAFTLVLLASPPAEGSAKANLSAWDQGRLQLSGEWKDARSDASVPLNADYLKRREKTLNTSAAHLRLSKWCRSNGMPELAVAHLRVAERLDSSSAEAQRALGRQLKDGIWGTIEEHKKRRELKAAIVDADKRWEQKLRQLPTPPSSLPEINDPYAIPALERIVSSRTEEGGRLAVAALSRMSHAAATTSLARHAVFPRWESVRRAAIEALRSRSFDLTIPGLIRWLDRGEWKIGDPEKPLHSMARLENQSSFLWQDVDSTIVCIPLTQDLGKATSHLPRLCFSRDMPWSRGLWSLRGRIESPQSANAAAEMKMLENFELINHWVEERREHSLAALMELTGRESNDEMEGWSRWWAEVSFQFTEVTDVSPTREVVVVQGLPVVGVQMSCFAAGTPVWTRQGLIAIERIEPGDLVLSRSSNTGELAYKPVVYRTLRPRTQTRVVEASGEKIQTTLGHPFFVAGTGWTKANDLTAKQTLVTVDGTAPIASIAEGSVVQAYNLEVADFASYFVGKTGVLVHDNTPIRDEPRAMPGVAAAK